MIGYHTNIKKKTKENNFFRDVLFTSQLMQLVVMSLEPGDDLGLETYVDTDQYISVEDGNGKAIIDEIIYELKSGSALVIPAGAEYNIINTSATEALKIYTVYIPPDYVGGTIHKTRADGTAQERDSND